MKGSCGYPASRVLSAGEALVLRGRADPGRDEGSHDRRARGAAGKDCAARRPPSPAHGRSGGDIFGFLLLRRDLSHPSRLTCGNAANTGERSGRPKGVLTYGFSPYPAYVPLQG